MAFPSNPSNGEIYKDYHWDGESWQRINDVTTDTANKMRVHDTRSVSDAANDFNNEVTFDFKYSSSIGLSTGGTYCGVMTFAPWSDQTGDKCHQLAFGNSGIWWRTGNLSTGDWDSWSQVK